MQKTKKIGSLILALSMIVSLFAGVPSRAEGEETQTQNGLFMTWNVDYEWSDEKGREVADAVSEGAEWSSEFGMDVGSNVIALEYRSNGSKTMLNAADITIQKKTEGDENGTDTWTDVTDADGITKEDIKNADENTIGVMRFFIPTCGEYRLSYTTDSQTYYMPVWVSLPKAGFYSDTTASEETVLFDLDYTQREGQVSAPTEFYVITNPDVDENGNATETVTLDEDKPFMIDWDENKDVSSYISYEKVTNSGNAAYKVKVLPQAAYNGFNLVVRATVTSNAAEDNEEYFEPQQRYTEIHVYNDVENRLWLTDNFTESWGENGPTALEEGAEYRCGEMDAYLPWESFWAFQYGNDTNREAAGTYFVLTQADGKTAVPESEAILKTDTTKISGHCLVSAHFKKTGTYWLNYYEDANHEKLLDSIRINVDLDENGFYTSDKRSEESLSLNESKDDYEFYYGRLTNREIYVLFHPDAIITLPETDTALPTEKNAIIGENGILSVYTDGEEEGAETEMPSAIENVEALKDSNNKVTGYKITLKKNLITDETIKKQLTSTDDSGNTTYKDFYIRINKYDVRYEEGETPWCNGDQTIVLCAKKSLLETSELSWNYKDEIPYDGKEHKVELTGLPDGVTAVYEKNAATAAGTYTAKVTGFTYDTKAAKIYEEVTADELSKANLTLNWTIVAEEKGIQIKTPPTKTVYTEGETFDKTGMVVDLVYTDGTTKPVTDFTVPATALTAGTKEITVTYGKFTATQAITVNATKPEVTPEVKPEVTPEVKPEVKPGDSKTVDGNAYQISTTDKDKASVAFSGTSDKKAAKVTIPSTVSIDGVTYQVTEIADNAFAGCSNLTAVTMPSSITSIGKNAFKNCPKLKKVTIPKGVTKVGANAFYNCKKITTVKFSGKKVKKIDNGAFRKCSSLKSVTIPKSVTEIGKDAFRDCKKLNKITIAGTAVKKIGKNAFKSTSKNLTIKVPAKKKKIYKNLLKKAGYKGKVK